MTSRISVVITNYNYAQFLSQALDSVFAQTQRPHEVILVDDGSTDGSRADIERYDVHAILQANAGQSAALDAGVAAATGDVVCLLDADDAWHSTKIERVAYAFDQHPSIQWARHKLAIADARLEPSSGVLPAFSATREMPPNPSVIAERVVTASTSAIAFRRELIAAVFPLGNDLRYDADALLVARLGSQYRGWQIDEVLGYYRRHEHQQYAKREGVRRMLERQIELGSMIAGMLDRAEPVSNFKHRAVLDVLNGKSRVGSIARGVRASSALIGEPRLLLRQIASLFYAGLATDAWLKRFEQ